MYVIIIIIIITGKIDRQKSKKRIAGKVKDNI